jgi:hypothetical protein
MIVQKHEPLWCPTCDKVTFHRHWLPGLPICVSCEHLVDQEVDAIMRETPVAQEPRPAITGPYQRPQPWLVRMIERCWGLVTKSNAPDPEESEAKPLAPEGTYGWLTQGVANPCENPLLPGRHPGHATWLD